MGLSGGVTAKFAKQCALICVLYFLRRRSYMRPLSLQAHACSIPHLHPAPKPPEPSKATGPASPSHTLCPQQRRPQAESNTVPLENEAWWRIYENAAFVRSYLGAHVAAGSLVPQDFAFHVLRRCVCFCVSSLKVGVQRGRLAKHLASPQPSLPCGVVCVHEGLPARQPPFSAQPPSCPQLPPRAHECAR